MRTSRPIIYLIIAIIAALVIVSLENPWRSRVDDVDDVKLADMKNFDVDEVGRVEISQLLSGAILTNVGGDWKVEPLITTLKKKLLKEESRKAPQITVWNADGSRIRSELGIFSGLYRGTLVSDNRNKQHLYQVDDKSGLRLKIFDLEGRVILEIIIGKSGPDFTSTYVRPVGGDKVYLTPRPLTGRFSSDPKSWRNRKLWSINADLISSITITSKKGSYSVKRNGKLSEAEWLQFMGKFTTASAVGFADEMNTASAGLEKPRISLTLNRKGGGSVTLEIGGQDKSGKYYARIKGGDKTIYLLSKKSVESIPLEAPSPSEKKRDGEK